jgi:Zn-dependent protease with chaperone function
VFRLQAALGVVGMLAATAAIATAVSSVQHAPGNAGHVMLGHLRFTYPTLNLAAALLLVLAALGVAVLSIALRSGLRQHRAYRSFLRRMDILGSLQGHHAATVIEGSTPQAFCAGFLRPAVYVSRRTLELLSEDELHVVLAHEHHHLRVRDPLRLAIARILGQALFFLPILRPLGDRYGELAEITADHAAVGDSRGREGPLASALLAWILCSVGPRRGGCHRRRWPSLCLASRPCPCSCGGRAKSRPHTRASTSRSSPRGRAWRC